MNDQTQHPVSAYHMLANSASPERTCQHSVPQTRGDGPDLAASKSDDAKLKPVAFSWLLTGYIAVAGQQQEKMKK